MVSLARLLDRTGRRDEARTVLADIYGWFTGGFDEAQRVSHIRSTAEAPKARQPY